MGDLQARRASIHELRWSDSWLPCSRRSLFSAPSAVDSGSPFETRRSCGEDWEEVQPLAGQL